MEKMFVRGTKHTVELKENDFGTVSAQCRGKRGKGKCAWVAVSPTREDVENHVNGRG